MNPFMSIDGEERGRSEPKKSNNFEPFFSDSTLTFLTSENTFRLPILPSRRIVFLCLPQIFLCLPLIFLCLPLIFPGCASKSPILKGKWRKKGGAEAPPISLYKYSTFHRQKQEVLKPKKGVGCGKFGRRCVIIAKLLRCYRIRAWSCTSVHSLRPHPQPSHLSHSDAPSRVKPKCAFRHTLTTNNTLAPFAWFVFKNKM